MSLRLVDKDNVVALPVTDIATDAQAFVDAIANGELDGLETVIIVTKRYGRVDLTTFGESPTIADGIGQLELAKAKVISGAWR